MTLSSSMTSSVIMQGDIVSLGLACQPLASAPSDSDSAESSFLAQCLRAYDNIVCLYYNHLDYSRKSTKVGIQNIKVSSRLLASSVCGWECMHNV